MQDACVRAYRGVGSFADGNARAWVLTIVRHSAFTWLQKNRGGGAVLVDDLETVEAEQINRNLETPETVLVARDDAMRLHEYTTNSVSHPRRRRFVGRAAG